MRENKYLGQQLSTSGFLTFSSFYPGGCVGAANRRHAREQLGYAR